jgi:hypothetical protein
MAYPCHELWLYPLSVSQLQIGDRAPFELDAVEPGPLLSLFAGHRNERCPGIG